MQIVQISQEQLNQILDSLHSIVDVLNNNFVHLFAFMLFLVLLVVFTYFFIKIVMYIIGIRKL